MDWLDIELHAAGLGDVAASTASWLGIVVKTPMGLSVRIRLEPITIGGDSFLSVVTGGRSSAAMALSDVLAWNASMPPGATILLDDGSLWLRFLRPMKGLTPQRLTRLLAFVAREGGRLVIEEGARAERLARTQVFSTYAE